jgi:hypothetical protein
MMHALPQHTRKLTLTLAALAFALVAAGHAHVRRAHAQEEVVVQREKKEEPTCVVYGRAVYAETSRPVRRARVTLLSTGGNRTDLDALTDANGEFRIKGVHAGSYFVSIDAPGLMSPVSFLTFEELRAGVFDKASGSVGMREFFDVVEVDGKADKEVTVRARRGAAISGRVTYSDGDPAVGVSVQIMRRSDGRLAMFLNGLSRVAMSGLHTDDRGVYRIAGLPPGDYVVGVSEKVDHGGNGHASSSDDYMEMDFLEAFAGQQLLVTYHPHASSAKDAAVVSVQAGEERDGVDISIPDRELRTVAGVVRGRRDRALISGARISISRKDEETGSGAAFATLYGSFSRNTVQTDEQGRWQLKEIPDGVYTLSVTPPDEYEPGSGYDMTNRNASVTVMNANVTSANVTISNANVVVGDVSDYRPPRRRKRYAPTQREVRVSGGDMTELAVELSEGARISGTVTVEGGKSVPGYMGIMAVRVTPNPAETLGDAMQSANARGGEFTIEGLPAGKFFLHPNSYELESGGVYLKAITWNGKDILHEPLEVGEGATIEGVRIVFSSDPAYLEVHALTPDKKPAQNVNVFLIPADTSKWSLYAPQVFCSTGASGACTVKAAPGDYVVVTMLLRAGDADVEPEIRRRALTSPRVSLRGGETKTVEVSVTEK